MKHIQAYAAAALLTLSFFSCTSEQTASIEINTSMEQLSALKDDAYTLDTKRMKGVLQEKASQDAAMYADNYTNKYYNDGGGLIWFDRYGLRPQADSLIQWISNPEEMGLGKNAFLTEQIKKDLSVVAAPQGNMSEVAARLDYNLTKAYLRFAAGQRYGYTVPQKLLGTYTIVTEAATDSFYTAAIQHVESATMDGFLQSVQPTDTLYSTYLNEYNRATKQGDASRARLARINLERARWRYTRPSDLKEGKYVWVNLANYTLDATDAATGKHLGMKVCVGSASHHSPILSSEITHVELNPYWNVPYSIIKNEIAPRHAGTSGYFTRNRIRVIDRNTGKEADPTTLSSADMASGRYYMRQDNGAGNSLGRMIFRFPNSFSVYLHDTNNHAAFNQEMRALSHGCVRLENPLDLALFLTGITDEKEIDRLRLTIGKEPLTEYGRKLNAENPGKKWMDKLNLDPKPIVCLDYYTLYVSPTTGKLEQCSDHYGYDALVERALNLF